MDNKREDRLAEMARIRSQQNEPSSSNREEDIKPKTRTRTYSNNVFSLPTRGESQ